MNFLAHAYLSFGNPAWATGNLISDYVKGRKRYEYSEEIQQGITIHRVIDEYTDAHPLIKTAKEIFRPYYRLYAGAFVDVAFDHFLANDKTIFATEEALQNFTADIYDALLEHYHLLPVNLHTMFDRMRHQNWLYNYRLNTGIERSFTGLVLRSKYMTDSATAYKLFEANYETLDAAYKLFFPQLAEFTKAYIMQNIP